MTIVAVSPQFTTADLAGADLSKKIDVFEDQIRGWLLSHADVLASSANPSAQHSGFAILTLLLVYVESVACFIRGATSDGKSKDFFTFGMGRVFPGFDQQTLTAFHNEFYRQVRCGQLHQGLVRGKVFIFHDGTRPPISASLDNYGEPTAIAIDPFQCLTAVKAHFESYVASLRDPRNVQDRSNFETWFDGRAA